MAMVNLTGTSTVGVTDGKRTTASFTDLGLHGVRCLLVASTGGHLSELQRVADVIEPSASSVVVTFDTPQSRSLSFGGQVRYVDYIRPRDVMGTMRAARQIRQILREEQWDAVLSTGSAIALAALPQAAARGTRSIYLESYSRFHGPSTTGRLLAGFPGRIELYTQHAEWSDKRWRPTGSVLDSVKPADVRRASTDTVFVTLGTISPYRFDALVDRVKDNIPSSSKIIWQLGATTRTDLPGEVHEHMSRGEFLAAADSAGLVISHAGTGTAIELIEMGHKPILVPRRASRQEHVDDHQVQIVQDLVQRDLVTAREVNRLTRADLVTGS